jgi:hypothetical protein
MDFSNDNNITIGEIFNVNQFNKPVNNIAIQQLNITKKQKILDPNITPFSTYFYDSIYDTNVMLYSLYNIKNINIDNINSIMKKNYRWLKLYILLLLLLIIIHLIQSI